MRNKKPGTCRTCNTPVAVGAGEALPLAGGWTLFCAAHNPEAARVAQAAVLATVIRLRLDGGDVVVEPAARLNDGFDKYLDACRRGGARYAPARRAQVTTLAKVADVIAALKGVGFQVDAGPGLVAAVEQRAVTVAVDVAQAQGRAVEVNALLAQRGLALYPFQAVGIEWLASRSTALLADDMGLGKTIQALTAAPTGAPLLVICPAVAKGVWVREAKRFRPDLTPIALSGRGSFRWPQAGEMVVVNYDILPGAPAAEKGRPAVLPPELALAPKGTVVIADEAHALKSSSAQRTSRFRALAQAARATGGRTWLLTATPLLNRAPELWAMTAALGVSSDVWGGYNNYKSLWNARDGRFGVEWGHPTAAVATRLQSVMLRRMKTEVLTDLPAKTVRDLPVGGLSASAKKLCDKALAALERRGADLAKALASAEQTAEDGATFELMSAARAALALVKLDAALELVEGYEEAGEPVVVFSAHRAPIDALAARTGWAAITGETPADERTRIEEAFQAGQLKGVAATIKAGGVAITLTKACHAVFVDQEWTPALNIQAEDRIYRIGQSRGVLITRLVADHALDRRLAELLDEKAALVAGSVDAARRGAAEHVAVTAPVLDAAALAAETAAIAAAVQAASTATAALVVTLGEPDTAATGLVVAVGAECPF